MVVIPESIVIFLSILILRGCTLKQPGIECIIGIKTDFQSSFCEDAPWNWPFYLSHEASYPFNPHFARMHLETPSSNRTLYEFRGLSILILRGCTLKLYVAANETVNITSFNPHFARMHLETPRQDSSDDGGVVLSILILRGCTLKLIVDSRQLMALEHFQSSFCEDAPWNRVAGTLDD